MEADAINSVQFSNHGGYPTVTGQRLDGPQLHELADGLEANGLLRYDYLLTGQTTLIRWPVAAQHAPEATPAGVYWVLTPAKLQGISAPPACWRPLPTLCGGCGV